MLCNTVYKNYTVPIKVLPSLTGEIKFDFNLANSLCIQQANRSPLLIAEGRRVSEVNMVIRFLTMFNLVCHAEVSNPNFGSVAFQTRIN